MGGEFNNWNNNEPNNSEMKIMFIQTQTEHGTTMSSQYIWISPRKRWYPVGVLNLQDQFSVFDVDSGESSLSPQVILTSFIAQMSAQPLAT